MTWLGTHDFLTWVASPGRRLHYSVGMTITEDMHQAILTLPDRVWEPAYDAGGDVRWNPAHPAQQSGTTGR